MNLFAALTFAQCHLLYHCEGHFIEDSICGLDTQAAH